MTSASNEHDIAGAFGTIRAHDTGRRRGIRARLLTLIAIIGPGLIVMVGDNDAGGVSTYAQAGQNFGFSLLWTLPLLIPVLIVNQEMVARLGAVTGVGHGRLIRERISRRWGNVSISSILLLNFLIIVTEFIGVSLSMQYFGISRYFSVPIAVLGLFAVTASGSFQRWERFMMLFVALNFLVVPLIWVSHPHVGAVVHGLASPGIRGGVSSSSVLLIISIIGTTVAPWQLYFQQSNIVDKKITPRWLNYERVDTILGSLIVVIGASALMAAAAALASFGGTTSYVDSLHVAIQFGRHIGHGSGAFFALLLLNASVIGAAAVTLASSYALGDLSGQRQGLDLRVRDAKAFYGVFAGLLLVAGAVTLVASNHLLSLITLMVQAMCGLMLPSTTIFVLLLSNDRDILGPWINRRWLNVLASIIVTILVVLSVVMMVSTVFTGVNVVHLLVVTSLIGAAGLAIGLPISLRRTREVVNYNIDRSDWRTPRLSLLSAPMSSTPRRWLLRAVGAYLLIAGVMLVVRFIQLAVS